MKRQKLPSKTKRKISLSRLKKQVWTLFSSYIRQKYAINGYVSCVTCGARRPISEMHAGHYIHGNTKKTYFNEKNVFPQCPSCNLYRSGRLDKYALFLENYFGAGILQELEEQASKGVWKREELEDLLIVYKEKLAKLKGGILC